MGTKNYDSISYCRNKGEACGGGEVSGGPERQPEETAPVPTTGPRYTHREIQKTGNKL